MYLALQNPAGFHLHNKISDLGVTISGVRCKTTKGKVQETLVSSFIPFLNFNYLDSIIVLDNVCAHMHKF